MSIITGVLCHNLIYKGEATQPAFAKSLAQLKKASSEDFGKSAKGDGYEYYALLEAIIIYYEQHGTLPPDRKAVREFCHTSPIHKLRMNLMIEETLKGLKDIDEAALRSCSDPAVLVDRVIDDARKAHIEDSLEKASLITHAGPTAKVGKVKDPSGVDDAKRELIKMLMDDVTDSVEEQDPKEFLLEGGDDPVQMRVIAATDIQTERLEWLWANKIPQGKITLYVGKPDNGKSLAALDLIARVTTGRDFPDGEKNTLGPKKVLCSFSEDDEAQTIVPRLIAAGADLTKVIFLRKVVDIEGFKRGLSLKDDALNLQKKLIANPEIALVVLDPITAFIGDADLNRDKDIRPVLEALGAALMKSKATCVGIIHCNKRSDVDALGKILGGSSVAGVVRAAWDFSRDPENKDEYMMTHIKGNLSKKRSGIRYKTTGVMVTLSDSTEQEHPHTEWLTECDETANDVLDKSREKPDRTDHQTVMATALLNLMLDGNGAYARDIYKRGEAEGISEATIKRASYKLLDAQGKPAIKKQNRGDGWWWYKPDKVAAITERVEIKLEDVEVM